MATLRAMYDDQDENIELPPECKSAEQWGAAQVVLEKYKKEELCYERLVLMSINGDVEAMKDCLFIKRKFGESKAKTQAPDLARYLRRIKFEDDAVEKARFVRTFAR